MIFLAAVVAYFIVTAIIVLSICVLSARMSEREEWSETPLVENQPEPNLAREMQKDVVTSP
jgi:hypothetical protein